MSRNLSAREAAAGLAEIQTIPNCEDCDVLRGANLFARKRYGPGNTALFDNNLNVIITKHVDLGCKPCPVEELMKSFRKDRLAAIAAMF